MEVTDQEFIAHLVNDHEIMPWSVRGDLTALHAALHGGGQATHDHTRAEFDAIPLLQSHPPPPAPPAPDPLPARLRRRREARPRPRRSA